MSLTQVTIINNTRYNLTIDGSGPGNTTIGPESSININTDYPESTKTLKFWLIPSLINMEGTLIYGYASGVYADRGYLPDDHPPIILQTNCQDRQWIQDTNGGSTLLTPSEFSSGGIITFIFY